MTWHLHAGGNRIGPVSHDDLVAWARAGRISPGDLVWRAGMPEWLPAGRVAELAPVFAAPPPPAPTMGDDPVARLLLPVGRSGLAIAAGYLGLFALLILPAPLALLFGILAVLDIRRNPKKHGMGRAVFGIVMGALGTVLLIVVALSFLQK